MFSLFCLPLLAVSALGGLGGYPGVPGRRLDGAKGADLLDRRQIETVMREKNVVSPKKYPKRGNVSDNCHKASISTRVSEPPVSTKVIAGSMGLNCHKMLPDSVEPIQFRDSQRLRWIPPRFFSDKEIAAMSCPELRRNFYFPTEPLSQTERKFPLAFAMLLESDADQTLRLLRAVYWPQNQFCMHVDFKSSPMFFAAMHRVSSCLPNVHMSTKREMVYWGHISVLEAALHCMQLLADLQAPWRYVQILSGTDVPLKTNAEMVNILTILNGSNDCELQEKDFRHRYLSSWELSFDNTTEQEEGIIYGAVFPNFNLQSNISRVKTAPPLAMTLYKGSFAATLTRDFVKFALRSDAGKKLRSWLQDTYVPDEFFWPTLIHNDFLGAPGAFPGE